MYQENFKKTAVSDYLKPNIFVLNEIIIPSNELINALN